MRRPSVRGSAGVSAALVVLVLVVLSDTLLGGRVFSSSDNIFNFAPFSSHRPPSWMGPSNFLLTDPLEGWIPNLHQTRMDLSHGVLPLWNPDMGGGHPLFASQVDALLFPLTWLSLVLPFLASFAWVAALKLALAAAGTYVLARDLKLSRAPALLTAIAYAFGMFFVVWLEHPQTLVWLCLPWMMLATGRICASASLGATSLLGLSTGLAWLGGHPESAAFQMAAVVLYALFELIGGRSAVPAHRALARRAGLVAAGLLLGVALGAVTLLPLLELLHQAGPTNRGGPALPLRTIYAFVFPGYWGMPNKLLGETLVGPVNFNERTAYIGALPTLLAVASLGRRRPREVWFFVGLAALSFVVTFNIPGLATAIRHLPEANVARLTRFLIIMSLCGALLAGYGLQRWMTAAARERGRMLAVMGLAAVLPPLIWVVSQHRLLSSLGAAIGQLPTQHFHQTSPAVIEVASVWRWVLVCAVGLAALAVVRWRRWPAIVAAVFVLVLTGADLGTLDRNFHGAIPSSWALPPAPAAITYLRTHQGEQRVAATDFGIPANISTAYGLRDTRVGLDIPYPLRFSNLWTGLGGVNGDEDFILGASPLAHRLADIFATRYMFVATGAVLPSWLHVVERAPGGVIAINRTALPRAWVAYAWQASSGRRDDLRRTLASGTRTLERRPVIEGVATAPGGVAPAPTVARVTDDSTDEVTIHATAQRPGYLVLDDSAYPGWDATVDGHSVAWHDANENFRAVPVPAGASTVVFRYRPSSVLDGAIITVIAALTLIAVALAGATGIRRRRRITIRPREPAAAAG